MAPTYAVTIRDIPDIISQLQRSGKDGHFAVLMFVPPGSKEADAVNLQYSIEQGRIGLDWVLLGQRNIADGTRVNEFASKLGYPLAEHEGNGVRYLRLTGIGIAELGAKLIGEFYGIAADTKLDMITEGFEWHAH